MRCACAFCILPLVAAVTPPQPYTVTGCLLAVARVLALCFSSRLLCWQAGTAGTAGTAARGARR